jgi:hypothetical protein
MAAVLADAVDPVEENTLSCDVAEFRDIVDTFLGSDVTPAFFFKPPVDGLSFNCFEAKVLGAGLGEGPSITFFSGLGLRAWLGGRGREALAPRMLWLSIDFEPGVWRGRAGGVRVVGVA